MAVTSLLVASSLVASLPLPWQGYDSLLSVDSQNQLEVPAKDLSVVCILPSKL